MASSVRKKHWSLPGNDILGSNSRWRPTRRERPSSAFILVKVITLFQECDAENYS